MEYGRTDLHSFTESWLDVEALRREVLDRLGHGLPFDRSIHLVVGHGVRQRRTPPQWQWNQPAFDDDDRDVDPVRLADFALRNDDPGHPAIRFDQP